MPDSGTVCVYFVASPLQYLAARCIARQIENGARQVLVWYKPGLKSVVVPDEWDACTYMPWPRWEPMPGPFGRLRQLRANIRMVAVLVGRCDNLILHSAVFDTESINYFLRALPAMSGARSMHARILPDGLISTRRYPLNLHKRLAQRVRGLRRLAAPELVYSRFKGDRIGSDADFVDRIYVLPGLPNEYPASKTVVLPSLVDIRDVSDDVPVSRDARARRALVVGQPLVDKGHMNEADAARTTMEIYDYLVEQGITDVDYKAHPKDDGFGLRHPDYRLIEPSGALESYLASTPYDLVLGVRSTTLLFARQIYPASTKVIGFGWERIRFKSPKEKDDMTKTFLACGVELR